MHSAFLATGTLSENLYVEKISFKSCNYLLEFCRKFAAPVGKLQLFAPPTF